MNPARLFLLLLCGTFAAEGAESASPRGPATNAPLLLVPSRVFDAEDGRTHEGWVVLVKGNRIAGVGPKDQVQVPTNAISVALPNTTLLPGLMDIHSHLFLHPYSETLWNDQVLEEPVAYRTVRAVNHARNTLMAGFTLLRDMGTEGAGFSDLALKRAIEEGLAPGPRLLVCTKAIVATASYGPGPLGFAENVVLPKGAQEASGVPEVIKAVREQAGAGADWIKVYADYGRGPAGKQVPTFSLEELRALVQESHSAGRRVAAHAMTAEGMLRAIEAGVDTIEHGYYGNDEAFRAWRSAKLHCSPHSRRRKRMRYTLTATNRKRAPLRRNSSPPSELSSWRCRMASQLDWEVTSEFSHTGRITGNWNGWFGRA